MTPPFFIKNPGILLLAAGSSSRMGQPKQLLDFKGEKLIVRIAREAALSEAQPVVVVLGAYADQIQPELDNMPVLVVRNENWSSGMASSIQKGLETVVQYFPELDGLLLSVCDQPGLHHGIFNALISLQRQSGLPIAASAYNESLGAPALFHRTYFEKLQQLQGDTGARKILERSVENIISFPFPAGSRDIDSLADFEALLKENNQRAD